MVNLNTYLRLKGLQKSEGRLNNGILAQRALCMNIRIPKICFGNGNTTTLIGVPNHLSPMMAARIKRSTVVEYIALYHDF